MEFEFTQWESSGDGKREKEGTEVEGRQGEDRFSEVSVVLDQGEKLILFSSNLINNPVTFLIVLLSSFSLSFLFLRFFFLTCQLKMCFSRIKYVKYQQKLSW